MVFLNLARQLTVGVAVRGTAKGAGAVSVILVKMIFLTSGEPSAQLAGAEN